VGGSGSDLWPALRLLACSETLVFMACAGLIVAADKLMVVQLFVLCCVIPVADVATRVTTC
jgi:hypothetical protein